MPIEEKLEQAKQEIEFQIKSALMKKHMSQVDLAELLNESKFQINKAIKGNTSPKSVELRRKIYKVLGMEN